MAVSAETRGACPAQSRFGFPAQRRSSQPARLELAPDAVHVWWLRPGADVDADAETRLLSSLSPEERVRRSAYLFARSGRSFGLARGFARHLLSAYDGGDPAQLRIVTAPGGKPELVHPADSDPLHFNLTHTSGLIAVALSRSGPIGVDAEEISRAAGFAARVSQFLAPAERAALAALPAEAVGDAFVVLWTLKEAYAKARGRGLALPFDRFAFSFPIEGGIRLEVEPTDSHQSDDWHFACLRPTHAHHLAVASCIPGRVSVEFRHWPADDPGACGPPGRPADGAVPAT